MADDQERLERYLEWQRAKNAQSARRRRLGLAVLAISVGAAAAGLGPWLLGGRLPERSRRTSEPITMNAPPREMPSSVGSQRPPPANARPPAITQPVEPAPQRPVSGARTSPPRETRATRPSLPPRPAASHTPDASAAIAEPPAPPFVTQEPSTPDQAPATAAPEPLTPPFATQEPSTLDQAPTTSAPEAPTAVRAGETPVGAATGRPTPLRDRVGRWLRGEAEEFREGVKREIDEFRSGVRKVRRIFRRQDAPSSERPVTRSTG
jgi:hypothetical protein